MKTIIIDGKLISSQIKEEVAAELEAIKSKYGRHIREPKLVVILVGNSDASKVYVRNKIKACNAVGFQSEVLKLPANINEDTLIKTIGGLNNNSSVDGILVQMPLPKHINEHRIIEAINPELDVDGFHPINVGKLNCGLDSVLPCTPAGIIEILKRSGIEIAGKHCVVIGRSNIVGKPMAALMLKEDATVTVAHSKSENLEDITRSADILISAVGKEKFVTSKMLKPGAVVIDVGMNRDESGKLCGDVDFEDVMNHTCVKAITPVPGGVGPMTIAMLMKNTLECWKSKIYPGLISVLNNYDDIADSLIDYLSRQKIGDWIYPEKIQKELKCSMVHLLNALLILNQYGYLETNMELYCPACHKYSGQKYKTIGEVPEELHCKNCDTKIIMPLDYMLVVYKLIALD